MLINVCRIGKPSPASLVLLQLAVVTMEALLQAEEADFKEVITQQEALVVVERPVVEVVKYLSITFVITLLCEWFYIYSHADNISFHTMSDGKTSRISFVKLVSCANTTRRMFLLNIQ